MTTPKKTAVVMPERIVMRPTASLVKYARNSRTHDQRQVEVLAKSITDFGFTNPVLIDGDRGVIAGHGRIMAAELLGLPEVPCIELRHLTDDQKRAYLILDNQSALMSTWSEPLLAQELADLSGVGIEAVDLGFSTEEVDRLMETLGVDFGGKPEGDPDAVPEAPVVPTSKLGDVWLLGKHRVMCGDSTDRVQVERLMDGKKADMVFTDPPYGVSFVGTKGTMYSNGKKLGRNSAEQIRNDDLRDEGLSRLFSDALGNAVHASSDEAALYVFFAINRSAETLDGLDGIGISVRNWLVWDKGNVGFHAMGAQYKPNYEAFLYCHKTGHSPSWHGDTHQQTVWRHSCERLGLHPTMKPVALICQALTNHQPTLVLDVFGGSGSTLMACEKTGREARLMELDPAYVDVIVRRWQDFTGNAATLDGDGRTFAQIEWVRHAAH